MTTHEEDEGASPQSSVPQSGVPYCGGDATEALQEVALSGAQVANAYQHSDGSWRVNLHRMECTEWAEAPTLSGALRAALRGGFRAQPQEVPRTETKTRTNARQAAQQEVAPEDIGI